MIQKNKIILLLGFIAALLLAGLTLAGCGDNGQTSSTTAAVQCDKDSPSSIPPPSGKPQYVLFFRDTWPVCQKEKPIVDELEQEYKGKIDFIRYDLATPEGYCEYQHYGITHIPGMIFIDKKGNRVEVTDSLIEKPELKQKLDNLLARP